jgi:hypothetical protein
VKERARIGSDFFLTFDIQTDGGKKVITLLQGKVIDHATNTDEIRVWLYAPYNKIFGVEKMWVSANTTYMSFREPPNREEVPNAD